MVYLRNLLIFGYVIIQKMLLKQKFKGFLLNINSVIFKNITQTFTLLFYCNGKKWIL